MRDPAGQPLMVGVCHERASLAELGRAAVRREALPQVLAAVASAGFPEAVVLSTCSRTEIYTAVSRDARGEAERALDLLSAWSGLPRDRLRAAGVVLSGETAVAHLFRVAAGLESRLVGDVDVLAQVRLAWRAARDAGTAGPLLSRMLPAAIRCAEHTQAVTALGGQGRSLARRAVDVGLASAVSSPDLEVLVVGSGRMAAAACEHLAARGRRFRVAARDETYAERLAGAGRVCSLAALVEGIRHSDLLLCATSAAHPVVSLQHVQEAMVGRDRPLTVVDLAVPRNVDAEVGWLHGVRLVDLTALGDGARRDPEVAAAAGAAAVLVDAAARRFTQHAAATSAGPVIEAVRRQVRETCLEELRRHGWMTDPDALERAAHAVAGKILHRPTLLARAAAAAGDQRALLLLQQAFGPLDGVAAGQAEHPPPARSGHDGSDRRTEPPALT